MRIGFISYEYPPDTGIGGIATYVRQIALLFSSKNIAVDVICASPDNEGTTYENDYLSVTRIKCRSTEEFRKRSPVIAAALHHRHHFDMIEVPEYGAEGLYIKDYLPTVPLIIKLHTPKFLLKQLNDHYYDQTFFRKLKTAAGMRYNRSKDPEYRAIQFADHILSPSKSLIEIVTRQWGIAPGKIIHTPNPYFPAPSLLDIPIKKNASTILYMGRLETRKGVYNLAKAVPLVVQQIPTARFIFLGKDSRGPLRERSMKEVMLKEMGTSATHTQFIDHVPLTEIPKFLAQAAICVFPSLWENFPNVCIEAMSSARAVVASNEGGMNDMQEDIAGALLIDPYDHESIASGIIELLQNNERRISTSLQNRQKAMNYYGDRLLNELIFTYQAFAKPKAG